MKKDDKTPLIVSIAIFALSTIVLFAGIPHISIMLLLTTCLSGGLIIQGIVTITNKPPHIGLMTRLGKKIWTTDKKAVILGEGLNWVFLKGIVYDILLISKERRQRELNPQQILTPDNVDIKIPISLAWNIDDETCEEYINIGEDKGVDAHIANILEGRLREYSRHKEEGPTTWQEMITAKLQTIDFLVKALCQDPNNPEGKNIDEGFDYLKLINEDIPTPILLDWYRKKDPPNAIVRKQWGDGEEWDKEWDKEMDSKWKRLSEKIKELDINVNVLKEKIRVRISLLENLQRGNVKIKIIKTGAYLQRLTIGDVSPDPNNEIYKADIAFQREENERKSETYEVETDIKKAIKLKEALEVSKPDISIGECLNFIMKWKMIKDGKGFIYDGSLGNFAGLGDLISSIMKGGKS
ncbi:MAG: SPFH domain-containing protein [Candidatus Paceibacterota bacterium]